jgi:hypothetical protein
LAPIWSLPGFAVTNIITLNSTANLCINSATWGTYPGCSQTVNLQAGQRVLAFAEAGIMVDNNCDGISDTYYVHVDSRVAVNNNDFPDGAWLRTSMDNNSAYVVFNSVTLIGVYILLQQQEITLLPCKQEKPEVVEMQFQAVIIHLHYKQLWF